MKTKKVKKLFKKLKKENSENVLELKIYKRKYNWELRTKKVLFDFINRQNKMIDVYEQQIEIEKMLKKKLKIINDVSH